jgi:hypothetical protein
VARWRPSPDPVEMVVVAAGRALAYRLDPSAGLAGAPERVVVTSDGAELAGRVPVREWREPDSSAGLTVRLRRRLTRGRIVPLGERRLPLRSDGRIVEVLAPDGRAMTAGSPPLWALEVSA